MSKQSINTGTSPNDGTGDSIRVGMNKVNLNFTEIYNALGNGTEVSDISVTNNSASGGGSLSYTNRTLTFTPPDLSSYLTGLGAISGHSDVSISGLQTGQVLKWDGSNWVNGTDDTGISYTDLSVSYESASGIGTLTYDNTNGTFTFTPPDLSSYLTGIGTISEHTDVLVSNPQNGQVLKWNGSNWVNGTDDTGISYTDLSVSYESASGIGTLTYDNTNGTFTFTPPDLSSYLTGIGTISEHTDVLVSNPQNEEVLKWNGSNWVNGTDDTGISYTDLSVSYGSASGVGTLSYDDNGTFTFTPPDLSSYLTGLGSISGHSDVSISGLQTGQVLKWDGSNWVNGTDATATGGDGISYTDLSVSYGSASGVGTLTYNNNDGTFTFAPADFSGYLTGIGTISEHTDVSISGLQTGQVLKWDGSNWVNGTDDTGGGGISGIDIQDGITSVGTGVTIVNFGTNLTATLDSNIVTVNATDTNTTYSQSVVESENNVNLRLSDSNTVNDDILVTAGTNISFTNVTAAGFTVNSSVSRNTASATTGSIGVGNTVNISIAAAKTYVLYSIETDYPAWVTLYTDSDSRTNDETRIETQDPLPGSGVVAEVITTSGNLTQLITPGIIGFNNDSTPSRTVYAKVVNKHDSAVGIAVTIKYLKLED